eukprot:6859879-Prymnesium_polylepis.1
MQAPTHTSSPDLDTSHHPLLWHPASPVLAAAHAHAQVPQGGGRRAGHVHLGRGAHTGAHL